VNLLQRIKDILDELRIISNVKQEQERIVKSFSNLLKSIQQEILHAPQELGTTSAPHGLDQAEQLSLRTNESIRNHVAELIRLKENAEQTRVDVTSLTYVVTSRLANKNSLMISLL
jgi:exonuclease VII large subunit